MTGRTTTIVTTIDPGLSSKEEDRRVGYYAPGRSGSGVLLAAGSWGSAETVGFSEAFRRSVRLVGCVLHGICPECMETATVRQVAGSAGGSFFSVWCKRLR